MPRSTSLLGSTGVLLLASLALAGAQREPAYLRTVEVEAEVEAVEAEVEEAEVEVDASALMLPEDSVIDQPMVAADRSERARWQMPSVPEGPLPRWVRHRPVPGETIEQIALRFGVEPSHVRQWNELADDFQPGFARGRPRSLAILARQVLPGRAALEHQVRAGETWWAIGDRYGVDGSDLLAYNVGEVGRELEVGERIAVWIDPIVYASIVDDPEPDSPVRAGAHGVGSPNRGRLVAGVPIPVGEHWELRFPKSAYGTTFAVRSLLAALDHFATTSGYARAIKLGTMSRPRGGQVGKHESHQTGRDLDVRLPLRESIPAGLAPTPRRIDWLAVWQLLDAFEQTGAVQVIFLDYAMQKRVHKAATAAGVSEERLAAMLQWPRGSASNEAIVRHEPGHAAHMHVRFRCGPAEPECVD